MCVCVCWGRLAEGNVQFGAEIQAVQQQGGAADFKVNTQQQRPLARQDEAAHVHFLSRVLLSGCS